MKGLGLAAGIVALIAGILESLFALFTLFGAAMGGLMASGVLPNQNNEDALAGGIVVGIYGVFFLLAAIAGVLHLAAGISLLRNKPNPNLLWAATGASILPMCTMYCAVAALPAGIMLLLYLVLPDKNAGADPDILV
ncbi:MAG: hypothetical protein AB8H79_26605 [Myxococcota bacterium]